MREKRSELIVFRVKPSQKRAFKEAAKKYDVPLSEFIENCIKYWIEYKAS